MAACMFSGRAELLQQTPYGPESLKYLQSSPLQKCLPNSGLKYSLELERQVLFLPLCVVLSHDLNSNLLPHLHSTDENVPTL